MFRTALVFVALVVAHAAGDGPCGPGILSQALVSSEGHQPVPAQRSNWTCKPFDAGVNLPPRCCCNSPGETPTCLPSLVIIGAQKSGSTALFGYFLFHPQISPAKRKEVHFFDRNFRVVHQRADAKTYLMSFHEMKTNMVRLVDDCGSYRSVFIASLVVAT
jgi:hypothetical protein